jgi:phosphatidylglycerophosphate synthase
MASGRLPTLPLVRHLASWATPWLARSPLSANQVTFLSMAFGLGCAAAMARGEWAWTLGGAVMLVFSYVLDSCDGEIARLKNQCSEFGGHFDTFVDWIVHTAFFAGLGVGVSRQSGEDLWLWLGLIAAGGCTINYFAGIFLKAGDKTRAADQPPAGKRASGSAESHRDPETPLEWTVFVFRELTRADFWLIVLALSIFDFTWVLLPAGAIGAQIYWATQFFGFAREFYT